MRICFSLLSSVCFFIYLNYATTSPSRPPPPSTHSFQTGSLGTTLPKAPWCPCPWTTMRPWRCQVCASCSALQPLCGWGTWVQPYWLARSLVSGGAKQTTHIPHGISMPIFPPGSDDFQLMGMLRSAGPACLSLFVLLPHHYHQPFSSIPPQSPGKRSSRCCPRPPRWRCMSACGTRAPPRSGTLSCGTSPPSLHPPSGTTGLQVGMDPLR
jgi:hypothetical protein